MEETKLDRVIGRVFDKVENATKFLFHERKMGKAFSRLMLIQFFVGLVMILLLFTPANNPNAPVVTKILKYLQIPATIIYPLYFLFQKLKNISDLDLKILKFSQKFYNEETTKLCFEPIIADWKMEYSATVAQNLNWQARWISVRYSYAFIAAIFQQSLVGRLVEFIKKIFNRI